MSFLPLASAPAPLFGSAWLALLAVLVCVAAFMAAVAAVGRWLAATHPDPAPVAKALPASAAASVTPEVLAVIAAAVATQLGARARIAFVRAAAPAPSVEMLMQQWSLEGRRQIYSSHKVR